MTKITFSLPDVGEGLTEAEIVQWRVAPGDRVQLDQVFVEIETAKSLVELPSAIVGVVVEILVVAGTTIEVGTPILVIEAEESNFDSSPVTDDLAVAVVSAELTPVAAQVTADTDDGAGAMLVGHGSAGAVPTRRVRHQMLNATRHPLTPDSTTPTVTATRPIAALEMSVKPVSVLAKPPIRKLAKDLGVELSRVTATGPLGDITRDDVIREASQVRVFRNIQTPECPTVREDRIPVKGMRKAIASAMVQSAFQAPHVSVFVDVDASRTMDYLKRLKMSSDFTGIKISPLLIMARAMIWAVRRNPTVNSQWTDSEIIVKNYVNLGVAAATPRGLIVPNVKEAQSMSMIELATALEQLTLTAREGRTQAAEMKDGTITITNIGVFGMDTGTPILNPGEVAIVALGTIKQKPWVVDGEVRPRFVTTIGASFDHRVVDGDVASRFLADIASIIEEPALLLE